MNDNTGGPAFPGPYATENGIIAVLWKQQGMTLRDYFAAKWLQGAAADVTTRGWQDRAIEYAITAYSVADAMLKAREQ
jgi:hypothetical protein